MKVSSRKQSGVIGQHPLYQCQNVMVQSVFVVTSKGPSIQSYKQSNTHFLGLRIYLLTVAGGEKFSGKKLHLVVQN